MNDLGVELRFKNAVLGRALVAKDISDSVEQDKAIGELMGRLKPLQRVVLERRFGLVDGNEATLDEIGQDLKMSRARVLQIEKRAILDLRSPTTYRHMKAFGVI